MNFLKTVSCGLVLIFYPLTLQAQTLPKENDKKITINIQTDEDSDKKNSAYNDAIKGLTEEQKKYLEHLDQEQTKAHEPLFALSVSELRYKSCIERQPEMKALYNAKMKNMKYRLEDQLEKNRADFSTLLPKADFIDQKILAGHFDSSLKLQMALMQGMTEAAAALGDVQKQCADLQKELDTKYADAYAIPVDQDNMVVNIMRHPGTGRIESCLLNWGYEKDGYFFSATMPFINNQKEKNRLTFSQKLLQRPDNYLDIKNGWIDFNTLNTRYDGFSVSRNEKMLIGFLPENKIAEILKGVAKNGSTLSVRADGLEKDISFSVPPPKTEMIQKAVNCIASIAPEYSQSLKDQGFFPTPDKQHEVAAKKPEPARDPYYKVSQMSDDLENPGGCILQFTPPRRGNREIGAALMTFGYVKPGFPHNLQSVFWLMGADQIAGQQPQRLDFSEGWFVTKNSKTGETLDTRTFKAATKAGQRYEIAMSADVAHPFVLAMTSNGVVLNGKISGAGDSVQEVIPPPNDDSYETYRQCLGKLIAADKVRKEKGYQ